MAFNKTTAATSSGKRTFGLMAAIWSASVGISALQNTLNDVYKVEDRPSYLAARFVAIAITITLTVIFTIGLAWLLGLVKGRGTDNRRGLAYPKSERRAGIEPADTGIAKLCVGHVGSGAPRNSAGVDSGLPVDEPARTEVSGAESSLIASSEGLLPPITTSTLSPFGMNRKPV